VCWDASGGWGFGKGCGCGVKLWRVDVLGAAGVARLDETWVLFVDQGVGAVVCSG